MKPEYIVIHHSLTKDGDVNDWDAIRRYHVEVNGWRDIGYQLGVEMYDGNLTVQTGRRMNERGAHTKEAGMNRKSIGICVVGNYDLEPPPLSYLFLLRDLCWNVMVNWGIRHDRVIGHRDAGMLAGFDWRKGQFKSCPGVMFPMAGLREMLLGRM
jgi:hypothetical protein